MSRDRPVMLLVLCLALAVGAFARPAGAQSAAAQSPAPDEPEANPGRPTVSTPATLTPVGYLQFETGMLGASDSGEFSSRYALEEVMKFSVAPRLELLASSEPVVHSVTGGISANGPGDVLLGAQIVLLPGGGVKPTIAVSYFHRVYGGDAPDLDTGSTTNSLVVLASADVKGFHYDTNVLFNEAVDGARRRTQFGQTLSISHPIAGRLFTLWRDLALHATIPARQRRRESMGCRVHGKKEPGVRCGLQPGIDEHIDTLGGVRGVHVSTSEETLLSLRRACDFAEPLRARA